MKRGSPVIMGILNVTPDSFSDGGRFFDPGLAVDRGLEMVSEGASIVDVGGESTRPGAEPVSESDELARVLPVVQGLVAEGVRVSIDSMKPGVARAAVEAGASVINDVGGLRDPEMRAVAAETGATVCIMHMRGEPRTMQSGITYEDVVGEVCDYLVEQAELAMEAGVEREKIWIDPGIGFGKTVEHNLQLIKGLGVFVESGYPVLVGISRKSFIGKLLGSDREPIPVEGRLEGTVAAQVLAWERGARILRVHDVQAAKRSLQIAEAILTV